MHLVSIDDIGIATVCFESESFLTVKMNSLMSFALMACDLDKELRCWPLKKQRSDFSNLSTTTNTSLPVKQKSLIVPKCSPVPS